MPVWFWVITLAFSGLILLLAAGLLLLPGPRWFLISAAAIFACIAVVLPFAGLAGFGADHACTDRGGTPSHNTCLDPEAVR